MEKSLSYSAAKEHVSEMVGSDLIELMNDFGTVTFTKLTIAPVEGLEGVVNVDYTFVVPYEET